jgi:hypothetical protein
LQGHFADWCSHAVLLLQRASRFISPFLCAFSTLANAMMEIAVAAKPVAQGKTCMLYGIRRAESIFFAIDGPRRPALVIFLSCFS